MSGLRAWLCHYQGEFFSPQVLFFSLGSCLVLRVLLLLRLRLLLLLLVLVLVPGLGRVCVLLVHLVPLVVLLLVVEISLSSEPGTHKTVNARFWRWLSGERPETLFQFFSFCTEIMCQNH